MREADRRALFHAALTAGDAEAARALGRAYELIAACIRGDLAWLRRLADEGAGASPEPDWDYEWSALHYAANRGHLEVVRCLVERGAKVNRRENNDFTPILLAAAAGHWEVVRFLAAHGAEVGHADDSGVSVLDLARRRGPAEVLTYLESLSSTSPRRSEGD